MQGIRLRIVMSDKPVVTVVCKTCDTRLDEEALSEPHEMICPVCFSMVVVPAASQAAVKKGPQFKSDPDLEGYAMLPLEGPEAEARAKKAQDVILVVCPICRARLHVAPKKEAYHIKCHDCHELVRVPSRGEHRAKQKKEAIPDKRDAIEPVPVGQVETQDRSYSSWYLKSQTLTRRESDARPPKSVYFSSTFTFPWERELVLKWIYLSVGLTVFAMLGVLLVGMYSEGGGIPGMAMGFFALPLIWIGIWTTSYAASVSMAIITDTANGNQRIVNWADQNWRDWVITMAYVDYLIAVAALGGYVTNKLLELAGTPAPAAGFVVTAIAFPYVILSALETGGGLNFVSANVTLSLVRKPLAWLGFYLLAAILTAGIGGAIWGLWQISPYLAGALGGLLLAAWILILARLTGRLAWAISRE
jgi:hypothetical protein